MRQKLNQTRRARNLAQLAIQVQRLIALPTVTRATRVLLDDHRWCAVALQDTDPRTCNNSLLRGI
jgi:hypothetical protein